MKVMLVLEWASFLAMVGCGIAAAVAASRVRVAEDNWNYVLWIVVGGGFGLMWLLLVATEQLRALFS